MAKITVDAYDLSKKETDFEIILRERLIKHLIKREKVNLTWEKEDFEFETTGIYNIKNTKHAIKFRYKIFNKNNKNEGFIFRLCNVSFSIKNRRKGILTEMMSVVEELGNKYNIIKLQIESPSSEAIFNWMKKNRYNDKKNGIWDKEIQSRPC